MQIVKPLIAAGAVLALSAGAAFGQDNERGWEIGAGAGQFNVQIDGLDGLDEAINDLDADDMAWKVFLGYRFARFLSIEAAYINFGQPGDDFESGGASGDYNLEISGFAPSLIGTIPMGPLELFAKVGYYFYDVEVDADLDDLGGDVFQTSDSGEDLLWGAGIGMTFMQKLHTRLEYEKIDIEGTDDSNAFWLTAAWRF